MTAKIWLRRNGSMKPETMTALTSQTYECPTVLVRRGPRQAPHSDGACEQLTGVSRYRKTSGTAQRFQIWVMSPPQMKIGVEVPQTTPRKLALLTLVAVSLFGSGYSNFLGNSWVKSSPSR